MRLGVLRSVLDECLQQRRCALVVSFGRTQESELIADADFLRPQLIGLLQAGARFGQLAFLPEQRSQPEKRLKGGRIQSQSLAERRGGSIQVSREISQSPAQAICLRQLWIQSESAVHFLCSTLLVVRFHASESHQHVRLGGVAVSQDALDHKRAALVLTLVQQGGAQQVSESEVVWIAGGQRVEQGDHFRILATAKVTFR